LRRLGILTVYEIERERHALKALRGDFEQVQQSADKAGAAMRVWISPSMFFTLMERMSGDERYSPSESAEESCWISSRPNRVAR
jgi:hypothetical protein